MSEKNKLSLVSTIRERCRVCYTCVRECPAKAIRISSGQAEVIDARCIGCGNCVRVCSQGAKRVLDSVDDVRALLAGPEPVAACLAPSFPAEFTEMTTDQLVGMVRRLGFDSVHEVGFGADLVAARYRELLDEHPDRRYIATTCPAITSYVERFHPDLVSHLAPVVSPMIATARALRQLRGEALRVVFVGPCLAKKEEAVADQVVGEIDGVLTFAELRRMLAEAAIDPDRVEAGDFDPPHAGAGTLFPLSRGMLVAAKIEDDLVSGQIVAAGGRSEFQDVIKEFDSADLDVRLLEVLCCSGCVMGPGMTTEAPAWGRRQRISQYARHALAREDGGRREADLRAVAGLDLGRGYAADDQRLVAPSRPNCRRSSPGWASATRATSSTAAPAATTPAGSTLSPSTTASPRTRCACPTRSRNCAAPSRNWPSRTSSWPAPRRRWCTARSWPRWASWPPASPTR
ncbi:MAG: 4Fe-4S binding protein [bacterium]|nr:4Fe-4S binding protein [bacterium]